MMPAKIGVDYIIHITPEMYQKGEPYKVRLGDQLVLLCFKHNPTIVVNVINAPVRKCSRAPKGPEPTPESLAVAQQLRLRRIETGWNWSKMAKITGVHPSFISYLARGRHNVKNPTPTLKQVCTQLGISLENI